MKELDGDERAELAAQIDDLKTELEAARIERDRAEAATVVMSRALEQMNELLNPHPPEVRE